WGAGGVSAGPFIAGMPSAVMRCDASSLLCVLSANGSLSMIGMPIRVMRDFLPASSADDSALTGSGGAVICSVAPLGAPSTAVCAGAGLGGSGLGGSAGFGATPGPLGDFTANDGGMLAGFDRASSGGAFGIFGGAVGVLGRGSGGVLGVLGRGSGGVLGVLGR